MTGCIVSPSLINAKNNLVFRQTVVVNLENGLHLVPCSLIAQMAREFQCEMRIRNGDLVVDAKNIFDLITLEAGFGTSLDIEADGDGANDAVKRIIELFETNFESNDSETSTSN